MSPPGQKQAGYLFLAITILVGIVISILACFWMQNREREKMTAEFRISAKERHAALQREIDLNLEVVDSIQAFYAGSRRVDRAEFRSFVKPFLARHKSIQALEWIPRIPDSRRGEYERSAREDGFRAFRITDRKSQGKMVRSPRRAEYFPVYFVEPYSGNEIALGFDLASNPTRKESLESSRDSGETVATARITLVQEREGQFGIIVFAPIYRNGAQADTVEARRRNLNGFSLGVFRIGDILEKSVSYLNPVGIEMYLYDRSAPAAESLLYYHRARADNAEDAAGAKKEGGAGMRLEHAETLNVGGRKWELLCRATPGFIAAGRSRLPGVVLGAGFLLTTLLAGYFLTSIQRTEQIEGVVKERTEQLIEAQEELVRREKLAMLGLIAGGMGNELRNPLGVMNNAVFYLNSKMPNADETVREYLDIIKREIDNSLRIISTLLDFNAIKTPQAKVVSVHELIVQGLEKCAIPENIQVQADIPETFPMITIDSVQMVRVLQNLISNAVQAMPAGGTLRIAARRRVPGSWFLVPGSNQESKAENQEPRTKNQEPDADFVEISVADTGEGIAPEHMDKIFQPLFTTRSRGIGLGLPLSQKLVEANGGRLDVESRVGEGTTFRVTLPVEEVRSEK